MATQNSASLPASFGQGGAMSPTGPAGSGGIAGVGDHLLLTTDTDSKTIKINSRNYTTSADNISFQSKPSQTVNGNALTGGQISPRIQSGITLSGSLTGLFVDCEPKGTAAGTVTGDVRALRLELVTDDAATRTITGNVNHISIRSAFSGTIGGKFCPIHIEFPETQTNSKTFGGLFDLTGTIGTGTTTVWTDAGVTSATAAGVLGLYVNGNKRYLNLFSGTPA